MKRIYIIALSIGNLFADNIYAQQGTLDSTFNANGIIILAPSASHDNGYAVAIQPDSSIVIGGMTTVSPLTGFDVCVSRIHNDGSIDSSFGNNGYMIYDHAGKTDYCYDADLQPDGKIVVCGAVSITAANTDFFAMRLNTNGSYDSTFGNNGIVIIPFSGGEDYIKKGMVQTDGKILLAGHTIQSGNDHATLIRLNTDGSMDTTFGISGIAQSNFLMLELRIENFIQRANGKYVCVGYSSDVSGTPTGQAFGFTADGIDDLVFGNDGIIALTGMNTAKGIAENNNTLYICGSGGNSGSNVGIIYALNDTGNYIPSFGTSGKTNVSLASGVVYNAITVQQDGKIIAGGGLITAPFNGDFLLSRFNTNGKADSTFATNGHGSYDLGSSTSENMLDLTLQPDGKIIGCGTSMQTTNNDIALIRVDASSSSLGVEDIHNVKSAINIFPNPANAHINISIPSSETISKVEVLSVTGISTTLQANGQNSFSLPALASGIYLLRIEAGKQVYYKKLMIN